MKFFLAFYLALFVCACFAADPRLTDAPARDANGRIARSYAQRAAFRSEWPCPSTGLRAGACHGWSVDHVIPLACGGIDAPVNMQWLPLAMKREKDAFERRIYGGRGVSRGCP